MFRAILCAVLFFFATQVGAQQQVVAYRVIDGDTAELLIDLGFDTFTKQSIRLSGFSAPELNQPGGVEAKERFEKALKAAKLIQVYATGKRSFARWVGSVYVDGVDVTGILRNDD